MKNVITGIVVGVAALTGVIGVLHVPAAQTFLGLGCPFSAEAGVSAEERDARRIAATARLAQGEIATARPAGPITLGAATRADLVAAATAAGLACEPDPGGLRCRADTREWFAELDAADTVVALVTLDYVADPAAARARLADATATVERAVGAPTRRTGGDLGQTLRQARVDFRRADYYAQLSATNVGDDRYLVAETYRALVR